MAQINGDSGSSDRGYGLRGDDEHGPGRRGRFEGGGAELDKAPARETGGDRGAALDRILTGKLSQSPDTPPDQTDTGDQDWLNQQASQYGYGGGNPDDMMSWLSADPFMSGGGVGQNLLRLGGGMPRTSDFGIGPGGDFGPGGNIRPDGTDIGFTPRGTPSGMPPAGRQPIDVLTDISGKDINYLRGDPYTSTDDQRSRAKMTEGITNQYDTARQQLRDRLGAQQGMSGVMADELKNLDQEEAQKKSDVDRDLFIRGADERRSRLAESRGIASGTEALQREREREAQGIEGGLYGGQGMDISALAQMLGFAPSISDAEKGYGAGMAGTGGGGSGVSDLASMLALLRQGQGQ